MIRLKRRINRRALCLSALLFSMAAQFVMTAQLAMAAPAAGTEQVAQLLDLLGVRALLEQTPAVLAAASEAQTQFLGTQPQPANWRRDLEAQLKPQTVMQEVTRFVRERALVPEGGLGGDSRVATLQRAQQRLQEPIGKRARYFDLAMTQPGAGKNLRNFIQQHKVEISQGAVNERDAAARRALLQEIDTASAASLLTATLQSAIAARVRQAATRSGIDAVLLKDEIAERQRYLAPLAVDYLLYDYRYLRDDELHDYRDLLRDDSVQWLLDLCQQALLLAIVGELTPPPNRPQ